jgi:TonB family protein
MIGVICVSDAQGVPSQPVRLSGGVMAGQVLSSTPPVYPPIARAAHVSGAVVLHAVIDKNGKVENLQTISGPEMLRAAAVEAVSNWRWRPYLLNGVSVEVDTVVTVNFNITEPSGAAPAVQANTMQSGPVKVAAGVMAANLVEKPDPICSPEHKGDKVSGTVVLDAIIGVDGRVANLNVISGPEALRGCVLDAVSQWVYKPYLVNGVAVEVETTITLNLDSGVSIVSADGSLGLAPGGGT